jgi:hypothetical protein
MYRSLGMYPPDLHVSPSSPLVPLHAAYIQWIIYTPYVHISGRLNLTRNVYVPVQGADQSGA